MRNYYHFVKQVEGAGAVGHSNLYQYHVHVPRFRRQVDALWERMVGPSFRPQHGPLNREDGLAHHRAERYAHPFWDHMRTIIEGDFAHPFVGGSFLTSEAECRAYFLERANSPQALYLIETSFAFFEQLMRPQHLAAPNLRKRLVHPDDAVRTLNERFEENELGFRYESGQIVVLSSEFLHVEAVEPALRLLGDGRFAGAEQEFRAAHAHQRAGRPRDAIQGANQAFESTMRTICEVRGWPCAHNATARTLIAVLRQHGLFPSWSEDYLNGLEKTLLSLPTTRNKTSGHGQGRLVVDVPPHFAAFALHTLAANVVFLVRSHDALGDPPVESP